MSPTTYEAAGVRPQGEALSSVVRHLTPTLGLPEGAEVLTPFGGYASVLRLSDDLAIALTTDGVGSKTIVSSALDRYDSIGYDCVAMNVNDVLCVGARPVALVDYIAVNRLDDVRTDDILRGLGAAAKEAGVAVPGGETAQLPEIIGSGGGPGVGEDATFDLVGACVGVLHPEEVVSGAAVEPGDALVGIASSGIHSNGLTLARKVLLGGDPGRLGERAAGLEGTLGEELLKPTRIYVRAVTALWDAGIPTPGLAHITGDGLSNLCRLRAPAGFTVEELPEPPAIFRLIQEAGGLDDAEMFSVFNMGVGFVAVVPADRAAEALSALGDAGYDAMLLGSAAGDAGTLRIHPAGLVAAPGPGGPELRPAPISAAHG